MPYDEYSDGVQIRKCLGRKENEERCQRKRWCNADGWYCHHHEWQDGVETELIAP